jgi:serine O-acetyltransferase
MFENLREDLNRAMRETRTDPNWKPSLGKRIEVMIRHSTWPVVAYRFSRWARSVRIPVIGQLLRIFGLFFRKLAEVFTSVHIDARADIGPGFVIHSVYAINLGATKIGRNFTIATGCLISHACRGIGDDVYFGPGAKLVGDAKIGNNVVIAANSLVLTDVRDNMMVMGVPARLKLPGGRPQRFVKKAEAVAAPVAEAKTAPETARTPASVSA